MAAVVLTGFIDNIHYLKNGSVVVHISEFRKGYKQKDGSVVKDRYLVWKCLFKQGLRKYINEHFSNKMYVEVKGDIYPYAIENEKTVEGYSLIGQTLNLASVPRLYAREEQKMYKESQLHGSGTPDIDGYNEPDF